MTEHPYQVMPDLTDEEYEELKSDIAERGVMVPIEFDENGNVLDGHHRLRACRELGIADYPTVIRKGMTEQEKLLHALTLNTARRHLTRDQKSAAIVQLIERDPGLSDRQIAKAVGVTHPTVGKYRKKINGDEVVKVTTPEEPEEGRGTFTCCICGKEGPALFERIGGRVVNVVGFDPWPVRDSGECCHDCWLLLHELVDRMPEDDRNRHYFGPRWQVITAVHNAMFKEGFVVHFGDKNSFDKYREEFNRHMLSVGIDEATAWNLGQQ